MRQNIQTFVDQGFDVIVTVGFLLGSDTATAAKANPDVAFIGVDPGRSASTAEGGIPTPPSPAKVIRRSFCPTTRA